jgi:hypothetical protein
MTTAKREKHPFIDKQPQIAERKRVGEQGPGDRSEEAAEQKLPGPHHKRDASTWAVGAGAKAPTPHRARARDLGSSEEA